MTKQALCLVEKWVIISCYTCKHYFEKMSPRSPYYPYMGVPACRLGDDVRESCYDSGERWEPDNVHSVLEVMER